MAQIYNGWYYEDVATYPGWIQYGEEQTSNSQKIFNYLTSHGVKPNPANAIIGNFQHESYLNPSQWEIGYNKDPAHGYGLGQWTPSTKITNDHPYPERLDGSVQLDFLMSDSGQWSDYYVNSEGWSSYYQVWVPVIPTLQDFFDNTTDSVDDLTLAWAVYWERPNAAHLAESARKEYADHWAGENKALPLWILCKVAQKWREL